MQPWRSAKHLTCEFLQFKNIPYLNNYYITVFRPSFIKAKQCEPRVPAVCQIYSAYNTQHGHIGIHSLTHRHTHSDTAAALVKIDSWMDR